MATQEIDILIVEENLKPKYILQVFIDRKDIAEELYFTSATDFNFFVHSPFWKRIFDTDLYKVVVMELATKNIVYDSRKD